MLQIIIIQLSALMVTTSWVSKSPALRSAGLLTAILSAVMGLAQGSSFQSIP
jgi:phage-related minor tail protein